MKIHSKIPLPSEVMEHFGRILVISYVYHVYVLFNSSLIFMSNNYYFLNVYFLDMQCHCMMGLFTDISKAWLTIDSDIYVWSYENEYCLLFSSKWNNETKIFFIIEKFYLSEPTSRTLMD